MGRLSGFRYREIAKRLKEFGFAFERQAAPVVMKSGTMSSPTDTPRYPTIPATCRKARFGPFSNKPVSRLTTF